MWAVLVYPLYLLGAYAAITLVLLTIVSTLPATPALLGFLARSMSAYLALLICAMYGTVASAFLRIANLHFAYGQWSTAKSFKYIGGALTGVYFEFLDDGEEILKSKRPVVIVGNHQTELDILLLGWVFPRHTSVTAKKSLRNVPFLGWFMSLSGTVFIDRVDRSQAMKAFDGAAKAMKDLKQNVFIFPEGTRSYSSEPNLLPFKKGAFHLAVQAQVDIVPVVAENYSRILNIKARRFVPGTARIKVLEPISTKGLTAADVTELTESTREKMLKAMTEMAADSNSKSVTGNATKKKSS